MNHIEALERLKALVEDCASEQPEREMNDVCVDLARYSDEYIAAIGVAIAELTGQS
jgi:hypothetical protein